MPNKGRERQNTKASTFAKHLLRHECESEPGFVCTCQTYHRSRQRCTHLLNTTQYFHFPRSRRREVRKSRGESTHPKTQQLHVLPQSIQPLTSGKATFIKNLSDRKRNVRRASIRSKRINGCNHTRGHITTTRYDSVTTRVWISVDDLSFSE